MTCFTLWFNCDLLKQFLKQIVCSFNSPLNDTFAKANTNLKNSNIFPHSLLICKSGITSWRDFINLMSSLIYIFYTYIFLKSDGLKRWKEVPAHLQIHVHLGELWWHGSTAFAQSSMAFLIFSSSTVPKYCNK